MKRNTELFDKIADQIEREPQSYDQETWGREAKTPCGTAHCVAGWAAALEGYLPMMGTDWNFVMAPNDTGLTEGTRIEAALDVEGVGAELLGLTEDEADALFHSDWEPGPNETVPEALRAIGDGEPVNDEHVNY